MIVIQHRQSKCYFKESRTVKNVLCPSWTREKTLARKFENKKDAEEQIKKLFGEDSQLIFWNMVPTKL